MMFAAITPLLQTGSFIGRFRFKAFLLYIFFWEILVYYPVAHWIWGAGFLSTNVCATLTLNILKPLKISLR
jgi:Amt family ammonium transporter